MQRISTAAILADLTIVTDEALVKTAGDARWTNAITKAWTWLIDQDVLEIEHYGTDHAAVLVRSATEPDKTYAANGVCQCRAYEAGKPCWHRAASRLVRLALARQQQPAEVGKEVKMDEPGDYSAWFDGQYLGSRRTRLEAEALVNAVVYEALRRNG